MAKQRTDILWRFLADTKSLDRGTRTAKRSLGGLESVAKRVGGVLAVTFGARQILQFGKDAITAASDYTESINAVEVATGRAASQIFELGETAATAFGISKTEMNEAAVAFAGFAKRIDAGDVGGVFEDIIQRATDFASVFNIEVSEAMEIFQSSLAGQSRPIRRFGKDLSDASVTAFAYENGIADIGTALDETQRVQARFGQLMAETEEVVGDFENTSGELANQQRILASSFKDTQVAVGNILLPTMKDFIVILNDSSDSTDSLIDKLDGAAVAARESARTFAIAGDDNRSYFDRMDAIREVSSDVITTSLDLVPVIGDTLAGAFTRLETSVGLAGDKFDDSNDQMTDLADTTVTYTDRVWDADAATQDMLDTMDQDVDAPWASTIQARINAVLEQLDLLRIRSGGTPSRGKSTSAGPVLHSGGIVPGTRGTNVPIMAQAGEQVTSRAQSNRRGGSGGVVVNFNGVVGDPIAVAQQIQDLLELAGQTGG